MTRINVYTAPGDLGDEAPALAGWFGLEKARRWEEDWTGTDQPDLGQAVYRTAQGRWVLEHWTMWAGQRDQHEFITDESAQKWLLANNYDHVVKEYFGAVDDERGPGRPEIGNRVNVFLGDLLPRVDAARHDGESRSDAVRRLLTAALG